MNIRRYNFLYIIISGSGIFTYKFICAIKGDFSFELFSVDCFNYIIIYTVEKRKLRVTR